MNRLQKKCFIVSAGLHLLLAAIALICPAFVSSSNKTEDIPIINIGFVPRQTTDLMTTGGGNPQGHPPQPLPKPSPPAPAPPAVSKPPEPAPADRDVAESKPDPDSFDLSKTRKERKIEVNKTIVEADKSKAAADKARADAQAQAKAEADQRNRRLATMIASAAAGIQSGTSPGINIELGPGTGGVPYANFLASLRKTYMDAWIVPAGIGADAGKPRAEIVVARDGKILSYRLISRSGNGALDDSVEGALRRVEYTAPLPNDSKEDQRSVTLTFDITAKLLG